WRTTDAGWGLTDSERLAKLSREQRQQLARATELIRDVVRLHGQGKYREALPLAQQALALRKGGLGGRHLAYAAPLNNLASLYIDLGDRPQALKLLLRVRDLRKEVQGERHPEYASALANLAYLYHETGDRPQALKLYLRARDLRKEVLGEKHPDYAM